MGLAWADTSVSIKELTERDITLATPMHAFFVHQALKEVKANLFVKNIKNGSCMTFDLKIKMATVLWLPK